MTKMSEIERNDMKATKKRRHAYRRVNKMYGGGGMTENKGIEKQSGEK